MKTTNKAFVKGMVAAGRLAADTLSHTIKYATEGMTTSELDTIADDFARINGGISACIGYKGYPKATCISLNSVLCHGVPDETKLQNGDILNIDVTVKVGLYYGDTSASIGIGQLSSEASQILKAAEGARDAGIKALRPLAKTGDIGAATQNYIARNFPQFILNPDIGGHGIGLKFHDRPFIPAVGKFGTGDLIRPWTCLTVEPIVCQSASYTEETISPLAGHDKCSVSLFRAISGLAAQFEHTVLITDTGYEILTEV